MVLVMAPVFEFHKLVPINLGKMSIYLFTQQYATQPNTTNDMHWEGKKTSSRSFIK